MPTTALEGTAGEVLQQLRLDRNLSRQALANKAGCHLQTILKLEQGKMKMTEEWIDALAKSLGVAPSVFLSRYITEPSALFSSIPIWAWSVSAGVAPGEEGMVADLLPVTAEEANGGLRAFYIDDDSLAPMFITGDIIVVSRDRTLKHGSYYVVVPKSNPAPDLRLFLANPGRFVHETSVRAPMYSLHDIRHVRGRVVRLVRNL